MKKTKRNRSNSPNTSDSSVEFIQPSKIHSTMASNDTQILASINDMLSNHKADMQSQLSEFRSQLQSDIEKVGENIKKELKADIDVVSSKLDNVTSTLTSEVKQLSTDVSDCNRRIEQLESDDEFARLQRCCELKLLGIKYAQNENIQGLFTKIASLIGFDAAIGVPTMVRTTKKSIAGNVPSSIILLKFSTSHTRELFYRDYISYVISHRQITLNSLECGSDQERVTIGENLTPLHQKIFVECIKIKKLGKVAQVFTLNGVTRLKILKTDKHMAIRSQRELDTFLATHNISLDHGNGKDADNRPPNTPSNTNNHAQTPAANTVKKTSHTATSSKSPKKNTPTAITNQLSNTK